MPLALRRATCGIRSRRKLRSAELASQQDIAPAAVFLASADSSWITGQTLHIAGGYA